MSAELIYYVLAFIFGACIGSFLNVVIWRLPRGEKLDGRSHCAHCNHELSWLDLFPVFSYIALRGRCRYCGKKISPRYWLIELTTAILFVLAAQLYLPIYYLDYLTLLRVFFIIAVCIVVFVIDLEHYLILDKIVFPAIGTILVFNIFTDLLNHQSLFAFGGLTLSGIAGAIAAGLPFFCIWYFSRGRWMGFGDVKLVIFIGMALGLLGTGVALFASFLLGSLVGIPLVLFGRKEFSSKVPFGTFLAVATVLTLFWGGAILHWYLGLITF